MKRTWNIYPLLLLFELPSSWASWSLSWCLTHKLVPAHLSGAGLGTHPPLGLKPARCTELINALHAGWAPAWSPTPLLFPSKTLAQLPPPLRSLPRLAFSLPDPL